MLAVVAVPRLAVAADRALYFSNAAGASLGATPIVFHPRDVIELVLNLRNRSLKDRDSVPDLAVEGSNASVRLDLMEFRGGVAYLPASFRVEQAHDVRFEGPTEMRTLWFLIGRSQPFYWIADHFGLVGKFSEKHWEGTYRITATYQGLASPPVFITIR